MVDKRTIPSPELVKKRMSGLERVNKEKQERTSRKKLTKIVIDKLVKFQSRHDVYIYIIDEYDRKPDDAIDIINEALLGIKEVNDRTITNLDALTCERLEKAAKKAYDDGKVKDAIAAISMLNDIIYKAKKESYSEEDNEVIIDI